MGEIKGQLLGIVAVIVTFGIVSGALFIAFDTIAADVANDITSKVEYKAPTESNTVSIKDYVHQIDFENMLTY